MNRFVFPILTILMLWFSTSSIASTLNRIYIEENDKGIILRVNDVPLGKVLQSIEGETGIQFHTSSSVLNDRITINITAPDWQAVVKQLLEPYSRAELWNTQLDLTQIHILSRAEDSARPKPQKQKKASVSASGTSLSPMLTREQLLKLGKRPFRAPLAPNLFDDPEIRAFLNQNGIHSQEDMKDIKKTRRVRIKARNIILQMSKAKQN